jgi:hypothetical protein
MRTLFEIEATAKRQLDGMRVNHDVLARDVLVLVDLVRSLQAAAHKPEPEPDPLRGLFGSAWPRSAR